MSKNELITFVDLDGVLVDFFSGVNKIFNIPNSPHTYDWFEDYGVTREQMNEVCGADFFANLDWMSDGHEIFRTITKYIKPENIYLLTCPMPNLESASGKARWVNKHLPFYNDRLIITRAPKRLLAGSDKLLIDDNDDNLVDFACAGGSVISVPRVWNLLCQYSDFACFHVEKEFALLKAEGKL